MHIELDKWTTYYDAASLSLFDPPLISEDKTTQHKQWNTPYVAPVICQEANRL